jgi:hypothetical protein
LNKEWGANHKQQRQIVIDHAVDLDWFVDLIMITVDLQLLLQLLLLLLLRAERSSDLANQKPGEQHV